MNENLNIFVFAHKNFDIYPNNNCFKLVSIDKMETTIPWEQINCDKDKDPIMKLEHAYSEGARLHYIWKNCELPEYVGTAHYRRFFDFWDNIPDMDELFKTYDAVLPNFCLGWKSVENHYTLHNPKDLKHACDIIKRDFPDYAETVDYVLSHDKFYPCNMFILKRDMFLKYCEFVFGVLDTFNKEMGFEADIDVFNHVINDLDGYCGRKAFMNARAEYQARIQAFLMERLSTIFFVKNIKNPYMRDILITEYHEEVEKEMFKLYEK